MSTITNDLQNQINNLNSEMKKRQIEIDQEKSSFELHEQVCTNIEKRLNILDALKQRGKLPQSERHEHIGLNDKIIDATKLKTDSHILHSRLNAAQGQDELSIEKLEALLYSEKRTKMFKGDLTKQKSTRAKKENSLVVLRGKHEEAAIQLEKLNHTHATVMSQALLREVETSKALPSTNKQNKKFLDEIELQTSRIKIIKASLDEAKQGLESANHNYQEALSIYYHSRNCLAELKYMEALKKFMVVAAELSATNRLAGTGGYKSTMSFNLDDSVVETAIQSPHEELTTA